jgi:hypothetical protein
MSDSVPAKLRRSLLAARAEGFDFATAWRLSVARLGPAAYLGVWPVALERSRPVWGEAFASTDPELDASALLAVVITNRIARADDAVPSHRVRAPGAS